LRFATTKKLCRSHMKTRNPRVALKSWAGGFLKKRGFLSDTIYQVVAYALLDHADFYQLRSAEIYMARQGWYCGWSLPSLLDVLHGSKIRSIRKLKMEFQKICNGTILGVGKIRSLRDTGQ